MGSKTRAFGAIVPDLPGYFTGGDTSDEALSRAAKAITQWIKDAIENGHNVLRPSLLVHLRAGRDWAGPGRYGFGVSPLNTVLFGESDVHTTITAPRCGPSGQTH